MITGENLFLSYKKKEVLRGLSLRVKKGEIVGLVGPNGVGKTTLIRVLSGLSRPQSGQVKVEQGGVYALIEQPAFYLDMTGRENVEYYLNRKVNEEEIEQAPFGCKAFCEEAVRKYSMGMRQKLALWMMLLSDSEILLLDEPSVSLDMDSLNELDRCLTELKKGRGVLISSHNFAELQNVCDRVLVMAEGKIVKELCIKDRQRDVYAIQMYGKVDANVHRVLETEGLVIVNNVLYMSGNEQDVADMVRELILIGANVCGVSKQQSVLEEHYHEVMKNTREEDNEERTS